MSHELIYIWSGNTVRIRLPRTYLASANWEGRVAHRACSHVLIAMIFTNPASTSLPPPQVIHTTLTRVPSTNEPRQLPTSVSSASHHCFCVHLASAMMAKAAMRIDSRTYDAAWAVLETRERVVLRMRRWWRRRRRRRCWASRGRTCLPLSSRMACVCRKLLAWRPLWSGGAVVLSALMVVEEVS